LLKSWPYTSYVGGLLLIAASLVALLSLFYPDGSLAEPLGRAMMLAFGWLAALLPVWIAGIGVLLVARNARPAPWPWIRLAAALLVSLSLLGIASLEAMRRAVSEVTGTGGGLLGSALTSALTSLVGVPSTLIICLVLLIGSSFVATAITPRQLAGALGNATRWAGETVAAIRARYARPAARLQINTHEAKPRSARSGEVEEPVVAGSAGPLPPAIEVTALPPPEERRVDGVWKIPPITIFQPRKAVEPATAELKDQARIIEETLASFNIEARVLEANQGPAVTQFGIEPALGVPVSRIQARQNDLALRLGAASIRIEAPVPGRRMMGIEVPNPSVAVVNLREILEAPSFDRSRHRVPLALGKDIAGKGIVGDLARMPHLLIAGATGSGKSVCINSIVACLLQQFRPDEMQMIMVDPKMVELISYNGVPHLRMPVVTEMDKVVGTLKWVLKEMERRYKLFASLAVRNIDGYHRLTREREGLKPMPYLIVIIDELADLMMTAPDEVEKILCRLAQLARATGIHLIVATQRPSVDVLTGLIKANFPTRIAFAVTSQVDSRVILDTVGAERLLGRGDMLFLPPDAGKPVRLQGTYVSDQEIDTLVAYWKGLGAPQYDEQDLADVADLGKPDEPAGDEMFDAAVSLARDSGRISVSLLQRKLGIGYPRAARLLDVLEERGIVGPSEDGRSREVLE
jgi:S-DNA-T family DNA segregation ATPase FtsK/SpoIIIE